MGLSESQIRDVVIQSLGKCLARNPDEIKGPDTLVQDLGLTSLDFIDLMFALEKSFKVRIRDADFDRLLKPTQDEALPPNLGAEEIENLSRFIPSLNQRVKDGPVPRNSVISMMTTDTLVNMIAFKLAAQGS
ncbi:MAG: acyl carrier protein [bacterium]